MLKLIIAFGLMFSSLSFAFYESDHIMMKPHEIKWVEGPASLPPGAKAVILFGDPKAPGPFSMRFKFPDQYQIPPHFHPQDENITVLSGTFSMATGDDTKAHTTDLPPGSFARMKAGTHHFARTKDETIVQLNGIGPWEIIYVNRDDDPRNKK